MNKTYIIAYKLFGEHNTTTNTWEVSNGTKEVQAASDQKAIAKAQETIGLYVLKCTEKVQHVTTP